MKMWNIRKVIVTLFLAGLLGFGSTVPRLVAADALQYTLQDLEEAAQSLDQYRNQWVVVNFWATWCGPCIREIPELMAFAKRYPEQVQVLGIAFEKTPVDEIRAFVAEFGVSYPVFLIGNQPLLPMEPLKGLPSTFLVSPSGQVVHSHVGPVTEDELVGWLAQYANGSQTEG